jgi:hypothetical protein
VHAVVDGGQVDRDDGFPALRREFLDRGGELDAGIVDQDVDLAEFGRRVLDQRLDLVRLAEIGAVVADLDAELVGDPLLQAGDRVGLAEAVQHHVGALGSQRFGDAEADTAGRARYQGCLAFKHISLP